jgi:hypothetical protein
MRSLIAIACSVIVAGCGADLSPSRAPMPNGSVSVLRPGTGDDLPDAGRTIDASSVIDAAGPPSLHFVSPMNGASFARDAIEASSWVARVSFQVVSGGVATVELVAAGTSIGNVDASGALTYAFHADGAITIAAIGRDASGTERARDTITITITPPVDIGCHAMLDALGLHWSVAPAAMGVADPVTVQPVIGGVTYRYETSSTPTPLFMDCQLAPRLFELSQLVSSYGVVEIEHIGIYNYRCIGGGDPATGCTPSQHAYARAIDLHAFHLSSGAVYDVTTDFVITQRADTCPIASSSEADRVLKEIACTLVARRIFQIVLTPNYNSAHRDHFHCDITAGSMYLGDGAWGVDPIVPGLD